jgi:hypothetical protein
MVSSPLSRNLIQTNKTTLALFPLFSQFTLLYQVNGYAKTVFSMAIRIIELARAAKISAIAFPMARVTLGFRYFVKCLPK